MKQRYRYLTGAMALLVGCAGCLAATGAAAIRPADTLPQHQNKLWLSLLLLWGATNRKLLFSLV